MNPLRPIPSSALLLSSAVLLTVAAPATGPVRGQEAGPSLETLTFMAGCWEGTFEGPDGRRGVIEERYTPPSENLVLGTTRYLLDGRAVQYELTSIRVEGGEVLLLPYPGGTPSEHAFRLTARAEDDALFEAPEHDFPRRIRYWRDGRRLRARIDGGEGSDAAMEWVMSPAPCSP